MTTWQSSRIEFETIGCVHCVWLRLLIVFFLQIYSNGMREKSKVGIIIGFLGTTNIDYEQVKSALAIVLSIDRSIIVSFIMQRSVNKE